MATTQDPLNGLLYIKNGSLTSRWNFMNAVGSSTSAPSGIGTSVTLTYSFLTEVPSYYSSTASERVGFKAFSAEEKAATKSVLSAISDVANISFKEVTGSSNLTFASNNQNDPGTAAYAYVPSFGYSSVNGKITSVSSGVNTLSGDVWINTQSAFSSADAQPGGYEYFTLLHEIGHALGLKHSFEGTNVLSSTLDNHANTVMSYTEAPNSLFRSVKLSGGKYTITYDTIEPDSLMPLDIAALQYLYGANTSSHAGDDTYTFDPKKPFFHTIWDGGGKDTISVSNFTQGCTIDLNAGHFSSIKILSDALPTGYVERNKNIYDGTNNLAIANNVTIENAIGGAGNDSIIGNAADNNLQGGAGNDTLSGGAGNDTLDGGTGNDTLSGGAGDDTYIVDNINDKVTEFQNEGTDTVKSSVTYTLANHVENLTLTGTAAINGTGNVLNNVLIGNSAANTLSGGAGDDTLDGGAGADTLDGGAGNDTYFVDNSKDIVKESSAQGTDIVYSSVTYTLGANVENLTLTGTIAINGTGNILDNTLIGNNENNILSGDAGNDVIKGEGGNDTIIGGLGKDTLTGGAGNDIFVFKSAAETGKTSTTCDVITDFKAGEDKIDLSAIDANTATANVNEAFTGFVTGAFTAAGQLKWVDGILYGNTNNDANAEFAIAVTGVTSLTLANMIA